MHNKVPFTEVKSFSDAVTFPYLRLPKISDVKRNDPVVFNYPMEDYYPVDKREHYVKRCLGLPGDQLNIKDGEVYINGETQEMPDRTIKQFQYFVRTQGYLNENKLKEDFDINTTGDANNVIDLRELHANIVRNYGNRVGQIEIPQGMQDYVVTISDAAIETFKQISNIDTLFVLNHKYLDKSIP